MMTKCKNITNRIGELENQINNISRSKKSFTDHDERTSPSNSEHLKNQVIIRQRPSTAPQDSSSTSLRVKVAQHMINQAQEKIINKDEFLNSSPTSLPKMDNLNLSRERPRSAVATRPSTKCSPEKSSPSFAMENQNIQHLQNQSENQVPNTSNPLISKGCWKDIMCNNINHDLAEKESDAMKSNIESDSTPIISIKKPPSIDIKPFCESMMMNPFNMNNEEVKMGEDVTVVGMVNNMFGGWSNLNAFGIPPLKLETPGLEEKKAMDNYLIDSLRGEIEKVRHKLFEIGKRPGVELQEPSIRVSKEENAEVVETPSGDYNNQSLVQELKDLQRKNDDLSKQLQEHKKLQESSMKKARDATHLLNAYEVKVNALHEQALKSSKMMAHSKEKFCNILRSRNCQIKNLYDVNQQLKRTILANRDQMKQLKNNYKLLKSRYREIEGASNETHEENFMLRESMRKLEKELKIVYRECSKLKEENVRFLKELNAVEEDVTDKYNMKLNEHKEHLTDLLMKSKRSASKLIEDVRSMSEQLHYHGNELEDMKLEVKSETAELQTKYKTLLYEYEALVRKFQEYEQFDEIKCSCIEQELREFSLKMKEKESIILRERDELKALVEELARAIKQNKSALHELSQTNDRQDSVIDELNAIIRAKDNQILQYEEELVEVRQRSENLEKEMEALRKILQETATNYLPEQELLLKELENVRQFLDQEKDNNLIKQKVIEDQEQTINNLKGQIDDKTREIERIVESLCKATEETNRLSDTLKSMEMELSKEKQEKRELLGELEDINVHKESLMQQVSELEDAIKLRCMDEDINQTDQKETIDKLEQQLKRHKQDWEMQKKILQKDKEKALHAARFASQKLLDTVNDFQKQMCQQKAAQTKLAVLLQGKEQQLESLTLKVKSLLPLQDQLYKSPSVPDDSHPQSICTSFCQIKQIYPGPEQMYQSKESIDERESRSFCMAESNSCSACCDCCEYSDT